VGATLVLWWLHLVQIEQFLLAAGVVLPWNESMVRVPAALLAGLAPFAYCGAGTRDGALVWLFRDVAPASTMAVVGLLTLSRYLVPGAAGIPFAVQLSTGRAGVIETTAPATV
jgi:hypothetical protein